jgi:hypothetical protein
VRISADKTTRPLAATPETRSTPVAPASSGSVRPASQDLFGTNGSKAPVALSMPPPPQVTTAATEQTRPAESAWYRFKKHVVLFFTGIDYAERPHSLDANTVKKLNEVLKPGDVLLRRTEGTTSNWVIPGTWGHAAIYAGDGKIVDATTHDVREIDLKSFCDEGDAVIVVSPKNLTEQQRADSVSYAKQQIGKPYDFDLEFEDDSRFTCTELVESSLRAASGQGWGEKTMGQITPKDFLNDKFDFVWSSMGEMVK